MLTTGGWGGHGFAHPGVPLLEHVQSGGQVETADSMPDEYRKAALSGGRVEFTPTFMGCPALEVMRDRMAEAITALGAVPEIEVVLDDSWGTDRTTPEGREKLESIFGPTPCRSLRYCNACRQPFEQFKTI